MTRRGRRIVLGLVKILAVLACFGFLAVMLVRNIDDMRGRAITLRPVPLLVSLPFAVAYLVSRALIWHFLVQRGIVRFPLRLNVLSWMVSLLGKYVPGKVFLLLGRVYFYRNHGAPATAISACFLVEACCGALVAMALFAIALLGRGDPSTVTYLPILVVAAAALTVFTHPRVLRGILNVALRWARQPDVEIRLRWRDVLATLLMMTGNWLVLGAGFYFLLNSLIDVSAAQYLFVTASFAVAGIIGVLALFAPSGLGVREGVLAFLLATVLPAGVAAVAAIIARVWMTLAEALCAGVALLLVRRLGTGPEDEATIDHAE